MSRRPCRVISQAFLRTKTNGLRRHKDGAKVAFHGGGRVDGQYDDIMVWEIYLFGPFMLANEWDFYPLWEDEVRFSMQNLLQNLWKVL